jgi:hypothetical protein
LALRKVARHERVLARKISADFASEARSPQQTVLFVLAVVLLVMMQIAGHIVIAIVDWRTKTDERDRLIELKGTRNAAYVLATGVFLALCAALFHQ